MNSFMAIFTSELKTKFLSLFRKEQRSFSRLSGVVYLNEILVAAVSLIRSGKLKTTNIGQWSVRSTWIIPAVVSDKISRSSIQT